MPSRTPSVVRRARWKLARALWPEPPGPQKLVTRWRIRACEAEATCRWLAADGAGAGLPRPEARSQNAEDALLWDLVGDRERGFFIEAGAFDGYTFSVSYLFECVGWSGLLVEPIPARAQECAQRRPASRVVTAALSRPGAPAESSFTRVPSFEMYSTLEASQEHRQLLERESRTMVTETTPVTTLDAALGDHTGPIDFAVIDVEGHELAVLEGFDVRRWRPTALLIEDNTKGADSSVRRHLEARGYVRVNSLARNDLFLRADEIALVDRLGRHWSDLGS